MRSSASRFRPAFALPKCMRILIAALIFISALNAYGVDTCAAIFGSTKSFDLPAEFGPIPHYPLSLENGRQKLDLVRINYFNDESGRAVVRDYMRMLKRIEGLRLAISVKENALPGLYDVLDELPPNLLNRIEFVYEGRQNRFFTYDLWAQDSSKPLESPIAATLVFDPRRKEIKAAHDQGVVLVENFPVPLQGGNIIVGDRHIFVGPQEIETTKNQLNTSAEKAKAYLEQTFGKPILVVGTRDKSRHLRQRSFHIDLDIVLLVDHATGKEKALVRSPFQLLSGLLKKERPSEISEQTFESLRSEILEHFSEINSQKMPAGTRAFLKELALTSPEALVADELAARYMQATLERNGYAVEFIGGLGRFEESVIAQRFFMGTNAILSGRNALIPGNNFPELDALNFRQFRRLGYEVYLMPSSAKTIECFGGIRCVSETFRQHE